MGDGKCDLVKHKTDLYPGWKPVKSPNRLMPMCFKKDLRQMIDKILEHKLITPCHSQFAIGAVLAQVQNGLERVICYASKSLNRTQSHYSTTKREVLAIVNYTGHFKHYLLGRRFKIITDHRWLQWLHSFKYPDALIARWLQSLAAFDYEIEH